MEINKVNSQIKFNGKVQILHVGPNAMRPYSCCTSSKADKVLLKLIDKYNMELTPFSQNSLDSSNLKKFLSELFDVLKIDSKTGRVPDFSELQIDSLKDVFVGLNASRRAESPGLYIDICPFSGNK